MVSDMLSEGSQGPFSKRLTLLCVSFNTEVVQRKIIEKQKKKREVLSACR